MEILKVTTVNELLTSIGIYEIFIYVINIINLTVLIYNDIYIVIVFFFRQ
jgi:hypothetical protein